MGTNTNIIDKQQRVFLKEGYSYVWYNINTKQFVGNSFTVDDGFLFSLQNIEDCENVNVVLMEYRTFSAKQIVFKEI